MVRRGGARAVAAALLLALTTSAYGFWTTFGAGSGSSAIGGAQALTLAPAVPTTALYPGASADVATTVTNPNAFRIHIDSIRLDADQATGGFAVDAGHAGCTLSGLGLATQTNGGAGWDIAPSSSGLLTLPGAITMSASAPAACQGATLRAYLQTG